VRALLNIKDGVDFIFLVKSHHQKVLPNEFFLVLYKIVFSYFLQIKMSKDVFSGTILQTIPAKQKTHLHQA